MANDRIIKLTIVGDATSAQKALKATGDAATTAEVKVEGFGKSFAKIAGAIGVAALLKQASDGIDAYAKKVETATNSIGALTKSQSAVTAAMALGNAEVAAGRAAYSDVLQSVDALTPVALRTGKSVEELYRTSQLLATLNSGPGGGVEGSIVAISEALAGDWTSAIERFNLPRAQIMALKEQGVPALDILNQVLAQSGVTMDTVTAKSKTSTVQQKIFLDSITRIGAEVGKPIFDKWTEGLTKLNKGLQSTASKEFIAGLKEISEFAATGKWVDNLEIQARKTFFLIADAYNNMIKSISGGKLNIDDQLREMRDGIIGDEAKLRESVKRGLTQPIADEVGGTSPGSAVAPAKMQAAGQQILANLVRGMDAGSADALDKIGAMFTDLFKGADGKADAGKLTAANIALAQALKETADGGQLTSETMYALSAAYGMQTPLVVQVIGAHNALTNAQNRQKDAAQGLADAQGQLQQVQNRAKGDLAGYEAAITSAQQAATAHAQATADALDPLQEALAGVRAAAEESGRASAGVIAGLQSELEGLQNQASANAAAFQQQIATAQAAYEQAQTRRQQLQGVLQAALNGEVESYLRINDIQDESIRKIAEKWQAEIDGERRAKAGADDRVKGLTRAGNKEELDYIEKIKAARLAGDTAEVRRLERARDASRKKRTAELEEAQARARVAGDEYDAAAEALAKEGKGQDEIEGQAEKAAAAEVTRIQTAATAQKAADDAAIAAKNDQIKRVQAAQAAEQERYAAQQRGIQAEIDAVNRAAKAQAKKDADDLAAAQAAYTQRQTYWNLENTGAQTAVNLFGAFAQNTTTIANDSKAAYDQLEKITKLDFQNVLDAAAAAKAMANQPPAPPQTQSGTPLAPAPQNTPGQTEGQIGPPGAAPGAQGPANMPPLLEGAPGAVPPPGYHSEVDNAGFFWFVPNGYSLLNYGKQQGPGANSGNGGDSTSMTSASAGGPSFLRAAGVGGGDFQRTADPRGGTVRDLHIHLPNVTDLGSEAQREEMYAAMRRELSSATRGGLGGGKVDQG